MSNLAIFGTPSSRFWCRLAVAPAYLVRFQWNSLRRHFILSDWASRSILRPTHFAASRVRSVCTHTHTSHASQLHILFVPSAAPSFIIHISILIDRNYILFFLLKCTFAASLHTRIQLIERSLSLSAHESKHMNKSILFSNIEVPIPFVNSLQSAINIIRPRNQRNEYIIIITVSDFTHMATNFL